MFSPRSLWLPSSASSPPAGALLLALLSASCAGELDDLDQRGDAAGPGLAAQLVPIHVGDVADAPAGVRSSALPAAAVAVAAMRYASERIAELGPRNAWRPRPVKTGAGGLRHVRLAQEYGGVPVFGGDLVVHLDGDRLRAMAGNVVTGLARLDLAPSVSGEAMLAAAKAAYLARVTRKVASLRYAGEEARLVILPGDGERPTRLAWHVVLRTEGQGGVEPGWWNSFYDAQTGALLDHYNGLATTAQASGDGGNAKVLRYWNQQLDAQQLGLTQYRLSTPRIVTTDMQNGTAGSGGLVNGPLIGIGDAAINDAHGFSEIALDMMQAWQGFDSIDGMGFQIASRVHYDVGHENASWNGSYALYGDGGVTFYPLSGDLSVVTHEIQHGFTGFHSNLTYSGQSGGLNESFSDIAGEVAEAYHTGAPPDFYFAKDVMRTAPALRYLCNPTADGSSIDHAASFSSGMDVHNSSGVMNKAFCLAARRFGSSAANGAATLASVQRISRAWYEANAYYWTASSTFTQGCQGVLDAAAALGFSAVEREQLRLSWADVGVFCGRPLRHFAVLRDARDHIGMVRYEGTWYGNIDLTSALNLPPAVEDPASYGVGTDQFFVFRDAGGHVHRAGRSAAGAYTHEDLTALIGATPAASAPMGYAVGAEHHIIFRDTGGHLRELRSFGASWLDSDLTSAVLGSAAPAGRPFGYARGTHHYIVFRASASDVYELHNNGSSWTATNLTATVGGPGGALDPMGYAQGSAARHVVFKDASGNLRELYYDGATWWNVDLTTSVAGSTAPAGAPFGYATATTQHIFFRGGDGKLHELFNNGAGWVDHNMTNLVGGAAPAGDPTGYFSGIHRVWFRGVDGHLRELFHNGFTWVNNDRDGLGGFPPVSGAVGNYVQ